MPHLKSAVSVIDRPLMAPNLSKVTELLMNRNIAPNADDPATLRIATMLINRTHTTAALHRNRERGRVKEGSGGGREEERKRKGERGCERKGGGEGERNCLLHRFPRRPTCNVQPY